MERPPATDHGLPPGKHSSVSPVQAYLDLQVGSTGFWSLAKYELLASFGTLLPGSLGLAFRRMLWPSLFERSGRNVVWGRNVVVRHPGKMVIGEGVLVDDDCFFDAKGSGSGEFRIGDEVLVSRGCIVSGKGGNLDIGPRANIGAYSQIWSLGGLSIGADARLAGHCYIGGGGYDPDGPIDVPMSEQPVVPGFIEVGSDCWLGAGVVVLPGVKVGRGSVVGAGSVVTRDIPAYSIAVGAPARVIRRRRFAPPEA
jgi:acetyltransferase-like isoleucine patch superfamily enzyme